MGGLDTLPMRPHGAILHHSGDEMAYDNILKAVKPGEGLTVQQQSDNYKAFGEMMKDGVYIPDLLRKINDMERRIEALDKPRESVIDAELFSVMENSVKEDPTVIEAKASLQSAKTRIISELCMRDEQYRQLFEDYRRKVNAAYISKKEVIRPVTKANN